MFRYYVIFTFKDDVFGITKGNSFVELDHQFGATKETQVTDRDNIMQQIVDNNVSLTSITLKNLIIDNIIPLPL